MRRRTLTLLLPIALALVSAGCGSKASSGGTGLGAALDYVPKGAPLVVVVDTNTGDAQYQQLDRLIGKFPFGGQVKQAIKARLNSGSGVDYDRDVKPLLGNDLVIAVTAVAPAADATSPYIVAWKVKDVGAATRLIQRDETKVGTIEGADLYRSRSGTTFTTVKDGTLVAAGSQADIAAALKRSASGDHMTESDFDAALGDLNKQALVRVTGDFQQLLSGQRTAAARRVKWIAALRTFGASVSADPDGIGAGVRVRTAAGLTALDLPLAEGAQAAPVVLRAGEVGIGLRDPARIFRFGETVAQVTDPAGYARFQRQKATVGRQLGIDVDRDLLGQLGGNASVSIALDGGFAMRADLRDPAAAIATLRKAAPRLAKVAKHGVLSVTPPAGGQGLYEITTATGKKLAFGVVGRTFVVATDPARAAQFAGESPSVVAGAKGALVVASDARALADAIAKRRGQGAAAQLVTGALGDLVGSLEAETGGLVGNLKLKVR
jgi:hypothetical protein